MNEWEVPFPHALRCSNPLHIKTLWISSLVLERPSQHLENSTVCQSARDSFLLTRQETKRISLAVCRSPKTNTNKRFFSRIVGDPKCYVDNWNIMTDLVFENHWTCKNGTSWKRSELGVCPNSCRILSILFPLCRNEWMNDMFHKKTRRFSSCVVFSNTTGMKGNRWFLCNCCRKKNMFVLKPSNPRHSKPWRENHTTTKI